MWQPSLRRTLSAVAGLARRPATRAARKGSRRKLRLDPLEDRTVPSGSDYFSQAQNGDPPTPNDLNWVNGILNNTQTTFFEGMSTLQRVYLYNIAGANHVLNFEHLAIKGSAHAYDYLTSWQQAFDSAAAIAPGTYPSGLSAADASEAGSSAPAGYTADSIALHGAFSADVDLPDDMDGVEANALDPVNPSIAAYEAKFGNRTLRIYASAPITNASIEFLGYDDQNNAQYALHWTSTSPSVAIEFGGHLAQGEDFTVPDVGYGTGKGAGSISGGPYHVKLQTFDGASTGSQDNQIQSGAVEAPPNFTIDKTGDTISKPTDPVNYKITIHNDGGGDLAYQSIIDSLVGSLAPADFVQSGTQDNILQKGETWTRTYSRTTLDSDPDPLINTVTAKFSLLGSIILTRSDDHSTDLFYPKIGITKVADDHLVAPGDTITYTVTITNLTSNGPSGSGAPDLDLTSISDSLAGNILSLFPDKLATGESATRTYTFKVPAGWDPAQDVLNTVTVHSNPVGFPNDVDASASDSVNVFKASIAIDKTGDAISKPTDPVNYTIKVTNTSTADTPNLVGTISDSLLTLSAADAAFNLAPGQSKTINVSRTVLATDPDPLVNTATATATAQGESPVTTAVSASDSHSTDLFYPKIGITKVADDHLVAPGDKVTYTVTIKNLTDNGPSGSGAPALDLTKVLDSLAGDITGLFPDTLATGESATRTYTVTVPANWDPALDVVNTVAVHSNPVGFPNDIAASAGDSVNVFKPSISVVKTGDTLGKETDPIDYTITVTNTSTADTPVMHVTLNDILVGISGQTFDLLPGQSKVVTAQYVVPVGAPDPVVNTAAVAGKIGGENPLTTDVSGTATFSTNLFYPAIDVQKVVLTGATKVEVGQTITYRITLTNLSSSDSPDLIPNAGGITDTLKRVGLPDDVMTLSPSAFTEIGGTDDNRMQVGEVWTIDIPYTLQAQDVPNLTNVAVAHFHPDGFPNDIADAASAALQVDFPPSGSVLPTETTCDDFVNAVINRTITPESLLGGLADGFNMTVSGGKITNMSDPGIAFYFTTFKAPVDGDTNPFVVTIKQTSTGGSPYIMDLDDVAVYGITGTAPTAHCTSLLNNAPTSGTDSNLAVTLPDSYEGQSLVLRVRIRPKTAGTLIGKPDPFPAVSNVDLNGDGIKGDLRNDFATFLGATEVDKDKDGVILGRHGTPLQAAGLPAQPVGATTLSAGAVQRLFREAVRRWRLAGADVSVLKGVTIQVSNLGGTTLAETAGKTIMVDDNAAGWGWFKDRTARSDREFTRPGNQGEQNRMDLLSVMMHEVGHLLGHDHGEGGVMAETLAAGTRLTPTGAALKA